MRMSRCHDPLPLPVTKCHTWYTPSLPPGAWRNYWMAPWPNFVCKGRHTSSVVLYCINNADHFGLAVGGAYAPFAPPLATARPFGPGFDLSTTQHLAFQNLSKRFLKVFSVCRNNNALNTTNRWLVLNNFFQATLIHQPYYTIHQRMTSHTRLDNHRYHHRVNKKTDSTKVTKL